MCVCVNIYIYTYLCVRLGTCMYLKIYVYSLHISVYLKIFNEYVMINCQFQICLQFLSCCIYLETDGLKSHQIHLSLFFHIIFTRYKSL